MNIESFDYKQYKATFGQRLAQAFASVFRFKTASLAAFVFRKSEPPQRVSRTLFGQKFVCDVSRSTTHQMLYLNGERAIEERHLVLGLLRKGMHAVDIGANIGYYLLMLEKGVGANGKVTVIEPAPENLVELQLNIDVNRYENVELRECAVGNSEGEVGLKSGINSGVVALGESATAATLRPLDALIRDPVDFIKIDVEGYEGQVLEGARTVIARDRPTIFIEIHPHMVGRFGFTTTQIVSELSKYYDEIVYYEVSRATTRNLASKVIEKYVRTDPMSVIVGADDFIRRCDEGVVHHPFWAVCTGTRAVSCDDP